MITAHDLNDPVSARIRRFKPLFENARPPDPETGDWAEWQALMGNRESERPPDPDNDPDNEPGNDQGGGMTIATGEGFATQSSSLLALPDPARAMDDGNSRRSWSNPPVAAHRPPVATGPTPPRSSRHGPGECPVYRRVRSLGPRPSPG